MPFPGIVAHYLDLANGHIAQAVRPELRPQEPPVNGIVDYFKSRWRMPEEPVTVDDVISTQLACVMMPLAGLASQAALPGGRRGFGPLDIIVIFFGAGLVVFMLSIVVVIFAVCWSFNIVGLIYGYIYRRFASTYHRLRGYAVPPPETRGRPRIGPVADELLAR